MVVDLELQRLYDRVRLVRGKGDRHSGTLCIMTFVALLAGDRHTDAPATASPVVRQFALILNDAMPDTERQRLKPFAPRIIGTADGFDPGRVTVLARVMQQVVFPHIHSDLEQNVLPSGPLHDPGGVGTAYPAQDLACRFAAATTAEDTLRNRRQLALQAARLLSACAAGATTAAGREWYWAQAVDLLDQLCDVGVPRLRCGLNAAHIEKLIAADSLMPGGVSRMVATLRRLGNVLAAGIGTAAAAEPCGNQSAIAISPAASIIRDEIPMPMVPGI